MGPDKYREIANYFCDLYEKYSINPTIDRLHPAYRVGKSDLQAKYPELNLTDYTELNPYIWAEMRRRKLKFK